MSSSSIFQKPQQLWSKKGVANFRVKPRPQIRPHYPSHQKQCPFIIKKGVPNFWVKPRLNETTTSSIIKKGCGQLQGQATPTNKTSLPISSKTVPIHYQKGCAQLLGQATPKWDHHLIHYQKRVWPTLRSSHAQMRPPHCPAHLIKNHTYPLLICVWPALGSSHAQMRPPPHCPAHYLIGCD